MSLKSIISKKIEEAIENYAFESILEQVIEDLDFEEIVERMITERFENGDINVEETIEDFISRELDSIGFEDTINEAIENALYNS